VLLVSKEIKVQLQVHRVVLEHKETKVELVHKVIKVQQDLQELLVSKEEQGFKVLVVF
jgi:hypothetical protein